MIKTLGWFRACLLFSFFLISACSNQETNLSNAQEHTLLKQVSSDTQPQEAIAQFKPLLQGLHYTQLINVPPSFWDNIRKPAPYFPSYHTPSAKPTTVNIADLHFMQASANDLFHDDHYDVITDAKELQNKSISDQQLPTIHVWQDTDGRIWTLDHRRVVAYILSGTVKQAPVLWASKDEVDKSHFKFSNLWGGKKIYVYLTYTVAMEVDIPNH